MNSTISTKTFSPLRIGITGGIGSGKSYICHQLESAGHSIFYCDDVAKHIIRTHPAVKKELTQLIGKDLYNAEGQLVKSVLAAFLCKGKNFSKQVDAIVHPRVADAFRDFCKEHSSEEGGNATSVYIPQDKRISLQTLSTLHSSKVVFMECALLFEAGFYRLVDLSILVHVSGETQVKRLMKRDRITRQQAQKWIDLQLSENEKIKRSDAYILNE